MSARAKAAITAAPPSNQELGEFQLIPLESLIPADDNLRHADPTDAAILSLAISIKEVGLLEPILVEPHPFEDGSYRIKAGERRFTACGVAGVDPVQCLVQPVTEDVRQSIFVVENVHREDLSPIELARGLKQMADAGATQRDIAQRSGMSQGHVSKLLGLLKLPKAAQEWVGSGQLTQEIATALAALPAAKAKELCSDGPPDEWRVRNAKAEIDREKRYAVAVKDAKEAGATLIDDPPQTYQQRSIEGEDADPVAVGVTYGTLAHVDAAEHASLECHVVYVTPQGRIQGACTNPDSHPAPEPKGAPSSSGAALQVRDVSANVLAAQAAEASLLPSYRKALAKADENPALALAFVARALFRDDDPWTTGEQAVEMLELSGTTDDPLEDLCTVAEDDAPAALVAFALRSYNADLVSLVSDVALGTPIDAVEQEQPASVASARRLVAFLQVVVPEDGIGNLEDIVTDFADTSEEVAGREDPMDGTGADAPTSTDAAAVQDEGDGGATEDEPSTKDDDPDASDDGLAAAAVTVLIVKGGKSTAPKFFRECSACGRLSGFNTNGGQAASRAQDHVNDDHGGAGEVVAAAA
jgi:ParB family chromosome partitioning protein